MSVAVRVSWRCCRLYHQTPSVLAPHFMEAQALKRLDTFLRYELTTAFGTRALLVAYSIHPGVLTPRRPRGTVNTFICRCPS